jgi:predicted DNA-binding transcriptional regulator AlpA
LSTKNTTPETLIDSREAARMLGVAEITLRMWRAYGNPDAPPFVRVGGRAVRYSPQALAEWAASRQCRPATPAPRKEHGPGNRKGRRGRGDR